jgi:hypothetical protein
MGLFDDRVFEVQSEGIRYIFCRNPYLEVDEAVWWKKARLPAII